MNKAIIMGSLGQDPELKYTPQGVAVCSFSIATNESYKDKQGNKVDKTEWHNVTCFKNTAEVISKYFKKGSKILVEGKLNTRNWEKEGHKFYKTGINLERFEFVDSKKDGTQQSNQQQTQTTKYDVPSTDFDPQDLPF